jgi:teichuronic acid biosynthesis glycosyltransferase TuaC
MRICLYTATALPKLGGQEAVVDALARWFMAMGHEAFVLAPLPKSPMVVNDSLLPYPVIRHPKFFSTRYFVASYKRFLLRAATRHRFDIIHCHDVYPTGYVASLCRAKLGIPLVITSHGGDARPGNVRISKPGMRPRFLSAVKTADGLISIGQFTTQSFLQLNADPAKIHSIPNGVDLTPFAHQADRPADLDPLIISGKYLLFLGRLAPRKGLDVLIDALAKLPPAEGVELVIAGIGELQPVIERQIVSLNLQSRIRLVGRVSGVLKTFLLQNARALVLPSRDWEAFPLVVLESYAAGRPVIGSRIPGLEDVVIPEETGLLVKSESSEDWSQALQRVRDDQEWLDRAGRVAKKLSADFGWDRIASRHIELYSELINRSTPGS